jgi:lysophospholipid acyltransferase (LPLAT)-like uncharacterized protein
MHAIMITCRVRRIGEENIETLKTQGQPWIYAAWHNNTASAVWAERGQGVAMMASASEDGELIARGIAAFGNEPIRGSSSASGDKAVRDMVRALRAGRLAAVTPDGPRGPKYQLQPGALWIAALSACPLVPYHIEGSRQWVLKKSWDQHKIPKPFSTVYVSIGEPFFVNKKQLRSGIETMVNEFERRMMENVARCNQLAVGSQNL